MQHERIKLEIKNIRKNKKRIENIKENRKRNINKNLHLKWAATGGSMLAVATADI
jgi:hypothetical protein